MIGTSMPMSAVPAEIARKLTVQEWQALPFVHFAARPVDQIAWPLFDVVRVKRTYRLFPNWWQSQASFGLLPYFEIDDHQAESWNMRSALGTLSPGELVVLAAGGEVTKWHWTPEFQRVSKAIALIIWMLGMLAVFIVKEVNLRRQLAALRRLHCPQCGYDCRGLELCPECGLIQPKRG